MALSLDTLSPRRNTKPPRMIIYGPPGVGKTALAAEFPDPVFLMTEDGFGDLELPAFQDEPFASFEELMEAIGLLYGGEHDRKTVVLDSLDWAENLVWAETAARNKWASIESPGYGKGYVEADRVWLELMGGLNALRNDKGMAIVMIAHEHIRTISDPEAAENYDRYELKMHKRAAALCAENADVIGFMNLVKRVTEKGEGPRATAKAASSGQRQLYLATDPSRVAKNRYSMPDRLLIKRGEGFNAIAEHIPALQTLATDGGVAIAAE